MADNVNPYEGKVSSSNFLPRFYKTDSNKKFLNATLDQLIQPGQVKKINGFVGRQNSKSTVKSDIFLNAPTSTRQNYQFEPGAVIKDDLGNTTFFKDYQDYINQLSVFGANVTNHSRLNSQEFYSWDPHIDWDKFINFQNYYWLPYGPDTIKIYGKEQEVASTYSVYVESQGDANAYIFLPDGVTRNPTIKLYRGKTYTFSINSPGNPFSFKTVRTPGNLDRYVTSGLTGVAVESGLITFNIPVNCPDILYYVSENDVDLGGTVHILSENENTYIDVNKEVLGKKTYTLKDGTKLSNGMKVSFGGNVFPVNYASGEYYVEGVGAAIKLVNDQLLNFVSSYTITKSIPFESEPYGQGAFSDTTAYAGVLDYIVINRASKDRNPWSRHNRWVHKNVIDASAKFNGKVADIDQSFRAVRPIIEFEADLRLYNFGTVSAGEVDLIDTYTKDVFSTIEGTAGYNIDGVSLAAGQRILFVADTDSFVKNKIFRVEFIDVQHLSNGSRQIHLVLEAEPEVDQTVLVKQGTINQNKTFWYNGTDWKEGQQKLAPNQPPLFDVVDQDGISFGNAETYNGTSFTGTKLFSYKVGASGITDSKLGFKLSYKNISNFGDIVFSFNLLSDTFQYKESVDVFTKSISTGYLSKLNVTNNIVYVNGWQTSDVSRSQAAVRIFKNSTLTNNFDIDIFDDINDLDDLIVKVYINGIRLDSSKWSIVNGNVYKKIVLDHDIGSNDVLSLRAFAKQPINNNGYYEIPINLQNNPLNSQLEEFTLGEVSDHVNSIVENLNDFSGVFPGESNIRDLGNITCFGTKFIQHSGPAGLSLYHITSQDNNVIRAIEKSRDDYNTFKRNFISIANSLGLDASPELQVNEILRILNKDKPKESPYYFSDMVPYTGCVKKIFTIADPRIKTYPLVTVFDLTSLSNKSVIVYLNDNQLLYGKEYDFDNQGFVVIKANMSVDDKLTVCEYETTDGSFVPETPTKLGIWPKYEPKIYKDTTLVTPRWMIQGHDGSQVLAYGNYDQGGLPDFRDALILELEKRIFNNIKVNYDSKIFDIFDIIPSYNRQTEYSLEEFNEILAPSFYKWTTLIDRDFTKPLTFDRNNPQTFNYKGHVAPDGRVVPGYWRGIYRWIYDTDRPNLCPWEMLGFTLEPSWWIDQYGPAPYTKDNLIMWQDISEGIVREPGKPEIRLTKFAKPFLMKHIPADENGLLLSPIISGVAQGIISQSTGGDFIFGDVSPIEGAWRRSSHYPFSVLITSLLMFPSKVFGALLDRSRVVRNKTNQLVYSETQLRITPKSVVLPNIYSSDKRLQTSGIINYIINYIISDNLKSYKSYRYDLDNINFNLSYRLAGFSSKEKFNLLLDSRSPASSGSVFVPKENYNLILNSSSPIKKITYSGVIITKLYDGFEVKGYSRTQPYFKYYEWTDPGLEINIGGISETFSVWTSNQRYYPGKVVQYNNRYYRVVVDHTSTASFESEKFQILSQLPIIGGKTSYIRKGWDRTSTITVPYGTKFRTIQEIVDFLLGYGEWLKDQGFVFDEFNNNISTITNWETSAKEFLFWTTQNWSVGQDKWKEWLPNAATPYESIVRYNGDYYRAIRLSPPSETFIQDDFVKLDGLSTIGSSVISLSPAAAKLIFETEYSVVDDIKNQFNGYEIFKVDGTPIEPKFLNSYREDNAVSYSPQGDDGIYGATFYLVQKEQVLLVDNSTMFNDTIYTLESGYKQDRIKVSGYVSINWDGSFNAPGFIFDQGKISNWESWKDYALGDIVKYKEFYYSALKFLPGSETFVSSDWVKLEQTPAPALLPNWNYKASQFEDFYSLDSDNFDSGQQKVAQHLIGYQKRQYLENIIKDDVSEFKFYQGMIIEKGTQNVLNKLFDVLSAEGEESLKFYEEWALRVGQYGASGSFDNIEFVLNEDLFKNNPQGFELVKQIDKNKVDFVIRQTPNDVYLKPLGYNSNPWPELKTYNSFLRSAGHVRQDEVLMTVKSLNDLLSSDITKFTDGDCVWCTFDKDSWNVYRYTNTNYVVKDAVYNSSLKQVILTIDGVVNQIVGDYLGIDNVTGFSGFYKVESVTVNTINLSTTKSVSIASPFIEQNKIIISKFVSQRVSTIDNIDSAISSKLKTGDLIWADAHSSNFWTTWEYKAVYSSGALSAPEFTDRLNFGKNISVNTAGTVLASQVSSGQVYVFNKAGISTPWIQKQVLSKIYSGTTSAIDIATVLSISPRGTWLVTGTPTASQVKTTTLGTLVIASETGSNNLLNNHGAVSIYQRDVNGFYTLIATVLNSTPTDGEKFGSSIVVSEEVIYIGAPGTNKVCKLIYNGTSWNYSTVISGTGTNFGYKLALSYDVSTLAVSSFNQDSGVVRVYKNDTLEDTISTPSSTLQNKFGLSITLNDDGSYIAIADPEDESANSVLVNQGAVFAYRYNTITSSYELYQRLVNYNTEGAQFFGTTISFMNNDKTLVIYSSNADSRSFTIFDANSTTFDSEQTEFVERQPDSGRVDIYDMYLTKWVYSESLNNPGNNTDGFAVGFSVASNNIILGSPYSITQGLITGKIYSYTKNVGDYSWNKKHYEISKPDVSKIKRVFLYNKRENNLLDYLDTVDPNQGKIPGIAEKEIKYKTFYDPAIYSLGTSLVNVDEGAAWGKEQVGALWWDLRSAKFINSYDADVVYRNNTWNTLAVGASVDVYEWVQSTLKPSEWDNQSDTESGIALGISGTSLYGDSVYATSIKYDNISKSKKTTYYYWVKNKKTVPNTLGRSMSASDVSLLISNPRGQGYRHIAFTGLNSFSLVNVKELVVDKDTILSVEYWTSIKTDQNIHTHWTIVSEDTVNLPSSVEQKWFDSLCGKDSYGRLVPDTSLPPKLKYGIENRPRQGIFVNRFEALKQFIEKTNIELLSRQVIGNKDISPLEEYDKEPSLVSGHYDVSVLTDAELSFTSLSSFTKPVLSPIISNGRITGIDIISSGSGYVVAPYLDIFGSGTGAVIRSKINTKGQIVGVDIISSGYGYNDSTTVSVRNYSVLVQADSQTSNTWAIYSYDPNSSSWSRSRSQTYDVRKYWSYVDWYANGYNQFTAIDRLVDNFSNLIDQDIKIGETIKVTTTNLGTWVLLEKYANSNSVDWTQSYKIVAQEKGTIQFSKSIYSFEGTTIGYDGAAYDGSIFDNVASYELRIILDTIKNNIFIDDLRSIYMSLFFSNVRYALSEQYYIDWIFKTSFVKAKHIVGGLKNSVTYQNDNLENFEDYILETTPYRTKVREFVSLYSKTDPSQVSVTDFDLQPIYDNNTKQLKSIDSFVSATGEINVSDSSINLYPWKHWLDNVGYKITELKIVDNGSGYLLPPTVTIVGDAKIKATARAFIANGKVNRIVLLTFGEGYIKAPTVVIDGGLSTNGVNARAVAIIGNGVVRSNFIKIKFDRITKNYFITNLQETETFAGTGSRKQFNLKWAPDTRVTVSSVVVDGVDVLRDDYTLSSIKITTATGYTSYIGSILFENAPSLGSSISVTYIKDWDMLNAADRIQYYYNPTTGQLGKDLSQLMTGIDYGGVIVNSLGFETGSGWGSGGFYTDKWDSYDSTFDDYITTTSAGQYIFTLPYTPQINTVLNVYHAKNSSTTVIANGTQKEYTFDYRITRPTVTVSKSTTTAGTNTSGSTTLTLSSTAGIVAGDLVIMTVNYNSVNYTPIVYGTTVKSITNSTQIILDQIITNYGPNPLAPQTTIPAGTAVTFIRTLTRGINLDILSNGTAILKDIPVSGSSVTISGLLTPVRIDDPFYGTVNQTNPAAVMQSILATGTSNQVSIPQTYVVANGDQIIIRKITSDGSVKPNETDYDTSLTGGELAEYSSATGLAADDIIVDGDEFVSPINSSAPEEVVPGQVVDSVAIKVYDRPQSASVTVLVDNYFGNGSNKTFAISQTLNSNQAVLVKVGSSIKTIVDDYTVDYSKKEINFVVAPTANSSVTIISFGFAGQNLLDVDYFVADGITTEFITKAPWLSSVNSLVYVNGNQTTPLLFKTDTTYDSANLIGLRFPTAPPAGSVINYIIASGQSQSFVATKIERIAANGGTSYLLTNPIGNSKPYESSMIVRVNQEILKGPDTSYFTIKNNRLNYQLDVTRFPPLSVDANTIKVYANGEELAVGTDYILDLQGVTVKINKSTYSKYSGKSLAVSTSQDSQYEYNPSTKTITFDNSYSSSDVVEVTTFYRHDILEIGRSNVKVQTNSVLVADSVEYFNYRNVLGGEVILDRPVLSDAYVWITKNNLLLTPGYDYKLLDNKQTVKLTVNPVLNDEITVITYSSNIVISGIAYMQFKDMLNRVHFKRLSLSKQTQLSAALNYNDLTIQLVDATNFDTPNPAINKPGIIEIHGERIEYFTKTGNILGQLRRGTLGTGTRKQYPAGQYVQNISSSENLPYTEDLVVEQLTSDGTNLLNISFVPKKSSASWTYDAGYVSSIPSNYGQADDIEVFVGGYDTTATWETNTQYAVDSIVNYGSYMYICLTSHTSSNTFKEDYAKWKLFIGNIRLQKKPYKIFNINNGPTSPAADVQLDADFAVDGTSTQIRLTTKLTAGVKVTVVRRTGKIWDSSTNILNETNAIAEFLKAEPGIWYTNVDRAEQATASSWDNTNVTLDANNVTFDKG